MDYVISITSIFTGRVCLVPVLMSVNDDSVREPDFRFATFAYAASKAFRTETSGFLAFDILEPAAVSGASIGMVEESTGVFESVFAS